MTKVITTILSILLVVFHGAILASTHVVENKLNQALSANSNILQQQQFRYEVGRKLGDALARGCFIFTGTVHEVVSPAASEDTNSTISYATVGVNVDEVLWGEAPNSQAKVFLQKATPPTRNKYDAGPWSTWRNVDLEVGKKLIVALWNKDVQKPVYNDKPDDIVLIVSDESLFPTIREVVAFHERNLQGRAGVNAFEPLESGGDPIISGYLIAYLSRRAVSRDVNAEAMILSSLLNNSSLPEAGFFDVARELGIILSRGDDALTDATRNSVTEALVVAGASENIKLARNAITTLTRLTSDNRIDVSSFLNDERRRKLVKNYLSTTSSQRRNRNSMLERQLGIKSP